MSTLSLKLAAWWNDVIYRLRNKGNDHWSIESSDIELKVLKNTRLITTIPLCSVVKIEAYKQDCLTFDTVCIAYAEENGKVTRLDELMKGFDQRVKSNLKPFTPVSPDWMDTVNDGAFKANLMILWQIKPVER
jgi:hypothetical protein